MCCSPLPGPLALPLGPSIPPRVLVASPPNTLPPQSLPPLSPLQLSRWSPCSLLQPPSVLSPQAPTWTQSSLRRQPMLLPALADITATGFGRNWSLSPASGFLCCSPPCSHLLQPPFLPPLSSPLLPSLLHAPFSMGGVSHAHMASGHGSKPFAVPGGCSLLGMARSHSRCPWLWR